MRLFKGNYQGIESTRYVVIAGYDEVLYNAVYKYSDGDESEPRKVYQTVFTQAIGVYDSFEEAIGSAVKYLTETYIFENSDCHISNIYELGDDNGYGFHIVHDDEKEHDTNDWCNILYLQTYAEGE
jgi:hypothetical protein